MQVDRKFLSVGYWYVPLIAIKHDAPLDFMENSMKKRNSDTKLSLVTNTTEPTNTDPTETGQSCPSKVIGYAQKPWNRLAAYVDRQESYLIEQAQSIVRRNFTGAEAKLLFQFVDIVTRQPFPETDLPASREQPRPGFWNRWFGGKRDLSAE